MTARPLLADLLASDVVKPFYNVGKPRDVPPPPPPVGVGRSSGLPKSVAGLLAAWDEALPPRDEHGRFAPGADAGYTVESSLAAAREFDESKVERDELGSHVERDENVVAPMRAKTAVEASSWDKTAHPRDEQGRFTETTGQADTWQSVAREAARINALLGNAGVGPTAWLAPNSATSLASAVRDAHHVAPLFRAWVRRAVTGLGTADFGPGDTAVKPVDALHRETKNGAKVQTIQRLEDIVRGRAVVESPEQMRELLTRLRQTAPGPIRLVNRFAAPNHLGYVGVHLITTFTHPRSGRVMKAEIQCHLRAVADVLDTTHRAMEQKRPAYTAFADALRKVPYGLTLRSEATCGACGLRPCGCVALRALSGAPLDALLQELAAAESYFRVCERDEKGWCLPSGQQSQRMTKIQTANKVYRQDIFRWAAKELPALGSILKIVNRATDITEQGVPNKLGGLLELLESAVPDRPVQPLSRADVKTWNRSSSRLADWHRDFLNTAALQQMFSTPKGKELRHALNELETAAHTLVKARKGAEQDAADKAFSKAMRKASGFIAAELDGGTLDDLIEDVWSAWLDDSWYDAAAAMQQGVREVFGKEKDEFLRESQARLLKYASFSANAMRAFGGWEAFKNVFIRAQYAATQEVLEKAGVKTVGMYRAVIVPEKSVRGAGKGPLSGVKLPASPLASWTTKRSVANTWEGTDVDLDEGTVRVVAMAKVPAASIFSIPAFGVGNPKEAESIVLGNGFPTQLWLDKAPEFPKQKGLSR